MAFLDTLKRIMDPGAHAAGAQANDEEEARVAAAALLVHAAGIDGRVETSERRALARLLASRFRLDAGEADTLIALGSTRDENAVDLYGFTSALTRVLDQDGRKRMIEMLWELVLADGEVDEYESNLVWRVAELLGVSTRDRVTLKHKTLHRREQD